MSILESMDRLFLDANVLFSAAYSEGSGLMQLWKLPGIALCSSRYAKEEAMRNLEEKEQRARLTQLCRTVESAEAASLELPAGIKLREKDVPILLAAIAARATHLLTGDRHDFGSYFGRTIQGIRILRPAEYLKRRGFR